MSESIPKNYEDFLSDWQQNRYHHRNQYQSHQRSSIPNLLPELAVRIDVFEVLEILRNRLGLETLQRALNPEATIESPVATQTDSSWMKRSNMVGVNVRTIHNFFNVVKYALTLPKTHDSIHLLPIWEPGVVGSLYGMVSWNLNPEFFSHELARALPHLDSLEKQLKVCVNLLHAMGKSVGMDVIPHTDRFSEMALTYPKYFEWIRRLGGQIMSQSEFVYKDVEDIIWKYLGRNGTANGSPISYSKNYLFNPDIPVLSDSQRVEIIFGHKNDYQGRLKRRIEIIQECISQGFETLPMTMAPPYRGLHINAEDFVLDQLGNRWFTYEFNEPQPFSRVFGPLTRYKFYHSKNDNLNWELDFSNPQKSVWQYLGSKYLEIQQQYNLDFMRGDMAHVQPRPEGVPNEIDGFYESLKGVKNFIQKKVPYFAFFAETFLAPPNVMGYGDENDHLEAIEADSTLGDLQASAVGTEEFKEKFVYYHKCLMERKFAPNFTVQTADKDDPRFDVFFRNGNIFRYFVSVFLTNMPSYVSLGFETRPLNLERNKNETYSKLYVFKIEDDAETDKVTHGNYIWGQNGFRYGFIERIRLVAESIFDAIKDETPVWLSETSDDIWVWKIRQYTFVAKQSTAVFEENDIAGYVASKKLLFDSSEHDAVHVCRIYED
jgi:hypothetical protein